MPQNGFYDPDGLRAFDQADAEDCLEEQSTPSGHVPRTFAFADSAID